MHPTAITIYRPIDLSYPNVPTTMTVDTAITDMVPNEVGGAGGYTFTDVNGTLPEGLTLDTSNGVISGAPTVATNKAVEVVIKVTDSEGEFGLTSPMTFPAVSKKNNAVTFSNAKAEFIATQTISFTATATSGDSVTYGYKAPGSDKFVALGEIAKVDGKYPAGEYVVKASVAESDKYKAAEATHNFTIIPQTVESIEITNMPSDREYFEGEALDLAGLKVTATYNDNTSGAAAITESDVTGYNANTVGEQTITVTYGGKTATFTVTVKAIELTGIEITTEPTKTEYKAYESFDSAGMVVKAVYNNGDSKTVTKDCTVAYPNGTSKFRVSDTYVTLTYEGKTVNQNVTVSKASIDTSGFGWDYTEAFTYDGNAKNVKLVNLPSAEGVTVTATYEENSKTSAGTYTAKAFLTQSDTENYELVTIDDLNWEIKKAELTIPTVSGTYTYSAEAQSVELKDGDHANIKLSGDQTGTDAGNYAVTAVLQDTANYKWADGTTETKTINWSIAAKEVIVTPDALSKVYGEDDPVLTYKTNLTGALAAAFENAVSEKALERAGDHFVGNYEIGLGTLGEAGDNFNVKLADGTVNFSITPAPQTLSIPATEMKVKIGQDLNLVDSNAASDAPGAVIVYSILNGSNLATLNGNVLTAGNTVGKVTIAVDAAAVNAGGTADAEYSAAEQKTFTVSIEDKDTVTITGVTAAAGLTYTGEAPDKVYEGTPTNTDGYAGDYEVTYIGVAPTVYAESAAVSCKRRYL